MIHAPCFDLDRGRRRGDVRPFIGPHPGERWFADAQPQEQISFKRQSPCRRHLGRVADGAWTSFDPGMGLCDEFPLVALGIKSAPERLSVSAGTTILRA